MKIGIAGAGLMGLLLAWRFCRVGFSVSLFDKDLSGQSSAAHAAAGMLSPYAEYEADDLVFNLGLASLSIWQQWLPEFLDSSWFSERGSIVMAHVDDKNQLHDFTARIQRKVTAPKMLYLDQLALLEYEPELNCQHSVFLPEEAVIDTRRFIQVLKQSLNHVDREEVAVLSLQPNRIVTQHKSYRFDWVFDCRGIGARENFSDLRAVRGELIHVVASDVHITRPVRLLHPRYRLYIVPRPQSVYVIGASEIEADDDSPMSVRTCLELLSAAYSVHKGFAEARIVEMTTALRPALHDNLPRIIHKNGMTAVNGLYRHGFLLAPVLVNEILLSRRNNQNHQTRKLT